MAMQFQKAEKRKAKLRLALSGPSGSGKTYSALAVAVHLGEQVAVIDTENGSASLYADRFDFDVLELQPPYDPIRYVQAIESAQAAGYDVLVIDSLSHAWNGKGGCLEMVDDAAKRFGGNKHYAWAEVTPKHNALVETINRAGMHVIATMRAKTTWAEETDDRGNKSVKRLGLAPVQRDGVEYEFTLHGEMDHDHNMVVSKTRCAALTDAVIDKPGRDLADTLNTWLMDGAEPPDWRAKGLEVLETVADMELDTKRSEKVARCSAKLDDENASEFELRSAYEYLAKVVENGTETAAA